MALETLFTPIAPSVDQKLYIEASFIETQVTLKDDLWQFFVSPNEFSFLNLSPKIKQTPLPRNSTDIFLGMIISLDTEIQIAERVVKDAVTLFGDIGGFSSFFMALLSLFVGSIPGKLFNINATASLFQANLSKRAKD